MQYLDKSPREAVAFSEARILRNGAPMTFESWETAVSTGGEYKSGLPGVGLSNNARTAKILVPLPSNEEMAFDTFLRPSEVRTYFPAFGDKIVIQVNRRKDDPIWIPVFTGTVEETSYDYTSGLATVTCSDGLDTLLDTPVNVEAALGIKRGSPFDQLMQALANVGYGNVAPFNWRKTIWTAPAFLSSSAPLYADYGRSSITGERYQIEEPHHFSYTTDVDSYVHEYAQNYGAQAAGKALVLTFRGYDVPGVTSYTNWNHRSFIRAHLKNGSEIEVGYHGDTKNRDYGYYVWTKHRDIVYADKYQVFPKPNNIDGYDNPAVSLIYDEGGITLVVGGTYKVVLSEKIPAATDQTVVVKVTAKNIVAGDVRLEDNWTDAINMNKNLPKTNVATELTNSQVFQIHPYVLDRLDGIQLGTYVKRVCEAGLAGFWIDEGGRPTIMDMKRMKQIFDKRATNIMLMQSDVVGSEAALSAYTPRTFPAWKAVQVMCHKTQLWYSSESPSTINDYNIPVYQHPADRPNEWHNGVSEIFIHPENQRISWGPVWTDVWTMDSTTKEPSSGSWIGATLTADRWENETLYSNVSAHIEPLVNSNYKMTVRAPGARGKKIELRTPQGRTGNGSILIEKFRNMTTPLVRAAWKAEKTTAKRTIRKPEWDTTMPVLELGDEELALLISEENAEALADSVMQSAEEMKGQMDDFEIHPDARIQVGDPRLLIVSDSQGTVKAHLAGTVSGIRLGYSHSAGLHQSLSVVLRYEKEFFS